MSSNQTAGLPDNFETFDPFGQEVGDAARQEALFASQAKKQAKFEGRIVSMLLRRGGAGNVTKVLRQSAKNLIGESRLMLSIFCQHFPDFPLWLSAVRLPYLHKVKVSQLFSGFTKLPFYKEWGETLDKNPTGLHTGLVFGPVLGLKGQFFLIYEGVPAAHEDEGVRLQFVRPQRKQADKWLTLEPLDQYLQNLGPQWSASFRDI